MGRKKNRCNKHHLLYQRCHWEDNVYSNFLRNYFVYYIPVGIHDSVHMLLHDIPMPPREELMDLYNIVRIELPDYRFAYEACEYLAKISNFKPFTEVMKYQAELLKKMA